MIPQRLLLQVFPIAIAIYVMYSVLRYGALFIHHEPCASSLKFVYGLWSDWFNCVAAIAWRHLYLICELLLSQETLLSEQRCLVLGHLLFGYRDDRGCSGRAGDNAVQGPSFLILEGLLTNSILMC